MARCSIDNLTLRYGEDQLIQLTDTEGTGFVDGDKTDEAIAYADGEIDGALRDAGYDPDAITWSRLQPHAEALAFWFLHRAGRTKEVVDDWKEANAFLARISERKVAPPGHIATEETAGGMPDFEASDQVFDSGTLDDFTRA